MQGKWAGVKVENAMGLKKPLAKARKLFPLRSLEASKMRDAKQSGAGFATGAILWGVYSPLIENETEKWDLGFNVGLKLSG